MALHRGIDGSDPVRPEPIVRVAGAEHERRDARTWRVATGTLACPECDAPVAPGAGPLSPADPLACPYCARTGPVREFLSLAQPVRPTRVVVRIVDRGRIRIGPESP